MMLELLFGSLLRQGALGVIRAGGDYHVFGSGEPEVVLRLRDRAAERELLLHPDLRLGELYMDGRLTMERGDVADLLALLMRNLGETPPKGWHRLIRTIRRIKRRIDQSNSVFRAKAHVAHHYDLSAGLYERFLDADRQYSCAYFTGQGQSLEAAQLAKKRHIAAKLHLNRPDLKLLDIGCGWGGLALDLARNAGADVLGITLSEAQLDAARRRAAGAGLARNCRFELADYRALAGSYDRIVSVGMFEHVGAPYYDAFFAKIRALLAEDGIMLLHTIGRVDGPGATNPWIAKYIFPGGYTPALSEIVRSVERNNLIITDIEVLRLHYAETLRQWRSRFAASRAEIARLYDERFCRMWEFYLAGSEMAFRYDGEVVFQLQLARRLDAVPITRDYMIDAERSAVLKDVEAKPALSAV